MAQGYVTTARGESLNMDALKDAANLPLVKSKQTKTEVKKRDYRARKPINVRGFQPGAGEHKVPEMPEAVADTVARLNPDEMPVKTSFTDDGEAKSLADVTGVKVTPTKESIARAKARTGTDTAPEEAASEVMADILGDLEAANPNAQAAAEAEAGTPTVKKTRSRSKKT